MSTVVRYRFHFRSPVHIGERGVGLEETHTHVPADTLFSAICSAWRWLYGTESLQNDLLAPFLQGEQPPLLLSSAFPFAGEVLFFPKPLRSPRVRRQEEDEKKFKSVLYWSQSVWERWVGGQEVHYEAPQGEEEPLFWFSDRERASLQPFMDPETDALRLWRQTVVPRVTLDRQTSASQIWFFGIVAFREGAGLWCVVRYDEESLRTRVEACLRLLGDSGLGGERGSGFGLFNLQVEDGGTLPEAQDASYMVTLSPCCPTAGQLTALLDEHCAYELLPRRGWVGSPEGGNLRRKSVWMMGEGAVLRKSGDAAIGRLVDVKPDPCPHPVWRYGYAFPLGVTL